MREVFSNCEQRSDYVAPNIKITGVNVYNIAEAIAMSKYPMAVNYNESRETEVYGVIQRRCERLGNATQGSGHDCFLKGIMVSATLHLPQYIWQQIKRYHFFDIISSMSTMHRITKMNLRAEGAFTVETDPELIEYLIKKVDDYNAYCSQFGEEIVGCEKQVAFQNIIASIPSGFILPAGICTNYLQLKTIYHQRKNHKMPEWRYFCHWCETLPLFYELCCK
jgi:hypothetical protein